jgi:hypothetical protein
LNPSPSRVSIRGMNLLADVITWTFDKECGKYQLRKEEPKALCVKFRSTVNPEKEEGYRSVELLIWGPMNYVQVWVRSTWNVIPVEDLIFDDDGDASVAPGKDYQKGVSPWVLLADHDSGWRDGVRQALQEKESIITGFYQSDWYQLVDPKALGIPL